jgi:hypothetical protein
MQSFRNRPQAEQTLGQAQTGHSSSFQFVHSSLGIGNELFNKAVVFLLPVFAHDGHARVVKNCHGAPVVNGRAPVVNTSSCQAI